MRPTAKSALAIVLLATTAVAGEAVAQSRSYGRVNQGFVTAESRFGNGTVSGPVRPGRKGSLEVMMPGGTWISCGRSCSETLRVETVDFWENKGAGRDRIDNPCGLFGCLSRSYGF